MASDGSLGGFRGDVSRAWGCEAAGEPPHPGGALPVALPQPQALCEDCVLSPIVWKENSEKHWLGLPCFTRSIPEMGLKPPALGEGRVQRETRGSCGSQ